MIGGARFPAASMRRSPRSRSTPSQGLAANRVLGSVYASMPATILVFGFFSATDTWLTAHPDLAVKFAGANSQSGGLANGASQRIGRGC